MNKFIALILAAISLCGTALAQIPSFPAKTIRLLVAYPPGGSADVLSRFIAEGLTQRLGQRVVVENKPGANGNIAADLVAKSPADGYTLLMTAPGPLAVNVNLYATLPFDPATAFAPVSLAGVAPLLLVVPASLPVRNLKELLDYASANPSKATFASQGNASSGHLTMELLKVRTGMQATHVPYKGSAPALNDLLAGHVTMMFDNTTSSLPLVRGGALRVIAVAEEKRLLALPDIPTVAEQGLPGFVSTPWFGVVTTAGTPAAVVEKLSAAINETLRTPAAQVRFLEMGVELRPNSPQVFERYIAAETVRWKEVVRVSGAKLD
jgi:tripartite-type tricarboxylate transporter receptor subunit TctC